MELLGELGPTVHCVRGVFAQDVQIFVVGSCPMYMLSLQARLINWDTLFYGPCFMTHCTFVSVLSTYSWSSRTVTTPGNTALAHHSVLFTLEYL